MVFTSPIFIFIFLPIVLLIYLTINPKYRNAWLLISSLVFYSWSGIQYTILLLGLVLINYICGLLIPDKVSECSAEYKKIERIRKSSLIISLIVNFGTLGFFKYFNFFTDNLTILMQLFMSDFTFNAPKIPLPVGISFFTFQIVSYIADIYFGKIKAQRSISVLALYMTLFPPFIAGPIIRYSDIEAQIFERQFTTNGFMQGVERFSYGFAKKILIANNMGFIADTIISQPSAYSTPMCWLGIICYTLQIYFDFSGYSDMVLGMGKMFGFKFLENFNYPYIARSIQDFWRRWHISLSSWFKDYLYIPLGGNRKGTFFTYRNLIIVFFATGLWHGASWNFVLWGLWHGCFLMAERALLGQYLKKIPLLGHIYTLLIVIIGWVFFRIEAFSDACTYLSFMFVPHFENWTAHLPLLSREIIFYLVMGIILSTPVFQQIKAMTEKWYITKLGRYVFQLLLFTLSLLYMTGSGFNPFIYFRF